MPAFQDLTGQVFGSLKVTGRAPNDGEATRWYCVCLCGKKSIVRAGNLKGSKVKSCGCSRLIPESELTPESLRIRLRNSVTVNQQTGCWEWLFYTKRQKWDYGQISIRRKPQSAHRLSYKVFKGEIPDGLFVCHSCDNPKCINPEHLFLGTPKDNTLDAYKKGRLDYAIEKMLEGNSKRRHKSVLTDRQIDEVLSRVRKGESQRAIAEDYGVSQTTISAIKRGVGIYGRFNQRNDQLPAL